MKMISNNFSKYGKVLLLATRDARKEYSKQYGCNSFRSDSIGNRDGGKFVVSYNLQLYGCLVNAPEVTDAEVGTQSRKSSE
jgi:hypothetical protein